ncbi:hypothetical protein ACFU9Y_28035 [Streptomyces sp. NPDC057621]|uniref:Secreted protein n=1 Tax=Streptomyces liliiviolaceus TaxID=2823109 RepID=A0A941BAB0_9ACTN|nr:hypothetical protein [Streptomyces liliiviolaceus]MBQ0853646.1 hypothetical protein [Streptomyces liliiviolaceus]
MKKRSMLAIASLATGFVVAAVTPSHSLDGDALNSLSTLDVQDTLSTVDQTISDGSLETDGTSPAQEG